MRLALKFRQALAVTVTVIAYAEFENVIEIDRLQSVISRFCGQYCVYYCMLRSRGIDMTKIVSNVSSDTALNDVLVHKFVCRVVNE